jgi:hypothetical protein
MIVALIALFVALGGPAQAKRLINGADIKKGTVGSKQIRDHTIGLKDLSKAATRSLELTADNSITQAKIVNGSVNADKLAPGSVNAGKLGAGSVGAGALADNSVTGSKIADGSLTTSDVAKFAGRFRVTQQFLGATITQHSCWNGEPQGLAPEVADADISQDVVLVTPLVTSMTTYNDKLTLTARVSGPSQPSRFVLILCNGTDQDVQIPANGITFSYVVFDIP